MKALEETGSANSIKYVFQTLLLSIYLFLIFPPLRTVFLTILGAKIHQSAVVMNVKFFNYHHLGFKGLQIGEDCFVGDETMIDLYKNVTIGNQVTIGQRVTILTHTNVGYKNHPLQKFFPKEAKEVTIESGTFIGAGSIILPGITIGKESFVAAGSVVTQNVPSNTLAAGVPAKPVRKIK